MNPRRELPNRKLGSLEPVPTLIRRARSELGANFDFNNSKPDPRPIRISRAPGRLDVMGGIADYTGSLVCEMPLDRAAAVMVQQRDDRAFQCFSFNLLDEHLPFTFNMHFNDLVKCTPQQLREALAEPGRRWAGYLVGGLYVLHQHHYIDLIDQRTRGVNVALLSDVPLGAGVSSSAAIEVATMMNLIDHFRIREAFPELDGLKVAAMCQQVENEIVGAPCGIMDQVTSCCGEAGTMLRMVCQPHELIEPLKLPPGVRVVGINSNVKHSVGGGQYGKTRCAAFMAHAMILAKMREMGAAHGKQLVSDPMNGYLANLDMNDYKQLFREHLPEWMSGSDFIAKHGTTIDPATRVEPGVSYPVQHAADHHVLEANRVREFARYIELAAKAPQGTREAGEPLDRAGHLMYASHLSYTNDAMLGADECDLLVSLVKQNEPAGLYGAKITGGGSGGTVAVLCDDSEKASSATSSITSAYQQQTGRTAELFDGSSDGAWRVGTGTV